MRIIVLILAVAFCMQACAQKVTKTYWGYTNKVHEEFQVNAAGVKDGYYKEYYKEGQLYKSGFYKSGKKSGLWTTYDMNWTGQISSTMEYADGKMNGQYKQWCWVKSKRYLCGDYVYKNDAEVKAKQYFNNGNIQYERDREKGIYKEWFEDGSPSSESKNGKTYKYQMYSADYYHNTEKKEARYISYDSLGLKYEFTYDYDSKYDGDHLKVNSLSISVTDVETKGNKTVFKFHFGSDLLMKSAGVPLDSVSVKWGYSLLEIEPTGYLKKSKRVYDALTGDIKICNSEGSCQIFHYFGPSSKYEYRLIMTNTEGKQVKESYFERNRKDDRHYLTKEQTYKEGKLVRDELNVYEGSTYKNLIIREYNEKGGLKSETNYSEGYIHTYYESGKLMKKSGFFKKDQRPCCYLTEYYESGKVKMDVPLKDSVNLGNRRLFYDENANVIKVEEFDSNNGKTTKTVEGCKEIGEYFILDLTAQYNAAYCIEKKKWNASGYYEFSYEYPKGQVLCVKSQKVLGGIYKSFTKAETEAERNTFFKEYESAVKKLLEIAKTDTQELNLKLGKVKKTEEIRQILGI